METQTPVTLLSWEAPSQLDHERSRRWYLIAGILTIAFIAYNIIIGAWTAAIVAILCAGAYFLVRNQKHANVRVEVTEEGMVIDGVPYAWQQWESFSVLASEEFAMLYMVPKKRKNGEFRVMTGNIDPYRLRDTLGKFLPQDTEKTERLFDMIIRFSKL